MKNAWSIVAALQSSRGVIAAVDARFLLAHVLGTGREYLSAHPEATLRPEQAAQFHALVERRVAGEPVAYLLGKREFYGLDFSVGPGVLIPRPETELLVELALERLPLGAASRVLDLGTGTGAIAIAIAHARPLAKISAVDISAEALAQARGNCLSILGEEHRAVRFLHGDWYAPVAAERFDLIVANPPYVALADPHLSQGDLRFEPSTALAAAEDGFAALRGIIDGAAGFLEPAGWLLVEHGFDQGVKAAARLTAAGFTNVMTHQDLAGLPRVSAGQRPPGADGVSGRGLRNSQA